MTIEFRLKTVEDMHNFTSKITEFADGEAEIVDVNLDQLHTMISNLSHFNNLDAGTIRLMDNLSEAWIEAESTGYSSDQMADELLFTFDESDFQLLMAGLQKPVKAYVDGKSTSIYGIEITKENRKMVMDHWNRYLMDLTITE